MEVKKDKMNDFVYNLCISNLRNEDNLNPQQKKEYTKFLLNDFSHTKNENALKDGRYENIYLKISYKYGKYIKKYGSEDKGKKILNWIYDNRHSFLKNNVKDIYLVGSAYELIFPNDDDREDKELEEEFRNDWQNYEYASQKGDDTLYELVTKSAENILKGEKKIKNCTTLHAFYQAALKKKEDVNVIFLFFRLYCERSISKNQNLITKNIDSFIPIIIGVSDSEYDLNGILQEEICNFLIFYFYDLHLVLKLKKYPNFDAFDIAVNNLVNKMISLRDANTFAKFLYGLNNYQTEKSLQQSEVYLRAASQVNYFKSMYFLSEIVKKTDPKEALDLYDIIIQYNNSENNESKALNDRSDRLERACALYQKGLVYAEGLFSKSINWEIVDQCWGDPESDLCIIKKDEITINKYISTENLNLQFIKYKADHGLLEAKHLYFMICNNKKLTSENDILAIYMHELCMYSNYDPKYKKEFEEYARRLDVGEGVEKDKKKAAKIRQKIKEAEKKAENE